MFDIIKKYNKLNDYIQIKEPEVKLSLLFSLVIIFISNMLKIYENFSIFESDIKSLFLCLIGGFIGLAGFALSGVAILSSMFNEKQIVSIEQINGEGTLEKIMSSFVFLSLSAVFLVILLTVMILFIVSPIIICNFILFNIIEFICVYFVLFNLFYTVALVANCISCFVIKNVYNSKLKKDFFDQANEVRIDYILSRILEDNISRENFLNDLDKVSKTKPDYYKELMQYFEQYYREE